ncbi:MAG: AAA family ATPase [Planctomycetes bacterium]|nr:AAA family ATPase [Planctomycetota bacterium]
MRDSLLRYLERERLAELRASRELKNLPLSERVECGEALDGLTMLSQGNGAYVVRAAEHLAKFREGDLLWLGDGRDVETGVPVRLTRYDAVAKTLNLDYDFRDGSAPLLQYGTLVLDRRSMNTGERFAMAVHEIFRGDTHPIARCLEGKLISDDDEKTRREMMKIARERGLDRSQTEAFARALARPAMHLIQGPPGTGKTRLISEILDECVARGERVAVVAYTHRAVDQVLLKFAERFATKKTVKIDSSRMEAAELAAAGIRKVPSVDRIINIKDSGVFGMTTHSAARAAERGAAFDRVIFDEAGQIPIPHAIASMRCAPKWIFVGDHAQLPPVVSGEHQDEHKISIFRHLVDRYPSTMLEITYRMNAGICNFPSRQFYGARLQPSPEAAERLLKLKKGGRFRAALDPNKPCVLVDVDHRGAAMRSRREAAIAAELIIEMIVHHKLDPAECAAVAPFRAQVMAIREQLEQRAAKRKIKLTGATIIETVERIQGREREFVILSLASSDPDWLASQSEFYYLPNRLNVALTRARTKCIILASPLAFAVRARTLAELKSIRLFQDLRDSIPRVDGTGIESEIEN